MYVFAMPYSSNDLPKKENSMLEEAITWFTAQHLTSYHDDDTPPSQPQANWRQSPLLELNEQNIHLLADTLNKDQDGVFSKYVSHYRRNYYSKNAIDLPPEQRLESIERTLNKCISNNLINGDLADYAKELLVLRLYYDVLIKLPPPLENKEATETLFISRLSTALWNRCGVFMETLQSLSPIAAAPPPKGRIR